MMRFRKLSNNFRSNKMRGHLLNYEVRERWIYCQSTNIIQMLRSQASMKKSSSTKTEERAGAFKKTEIKAEIIKIILSVDWYRIYWHNQKLRSISQPKLELQ